MVLAARPTTPRMGAACVALFQAPMGTRLRNCACGGTELSESMRMTYVPSSSRSTRRSVAFTQTTGSLGVPTNALVIAPPGCT